MSQVIDRETLNRIGLLSAYYQYKMVLDNLARFQYAQLCTLAANAKPGQVALRPTLEDCQKSYIGILPTLDFYQNIISANPHIDESMYSVYTEILGRYIIESNWLVIVSTIPCP